MKLQALDRPTLSFLLRVSDFGLAQVFTDTLFQYFFRSVLQSLKTKLSKPTAQIRQAYTLRLTLDQAICLRWSLEMWHKAQPESYAKDVLQKYFPEPTEIEIL